jgi:hypothetical protein
VSWHLGQLGHHSLNEIANARVADLREKGKWLARHREQSKHNRKPSRLRRLLRRVRGGGD